MGDDSGKSTLLLAVVLVWQLGVRMASSESVVLFTVQHKFRGRSEPRLSELKAHDEQRHGRALSSIDIPLGGDRKPTKSGLFYTKIGIGTPSKDYYVQVDTGSDLLWVNCFGCSKCPTKSTLGMDLTLYNSKESSTADLVMCDKEFCTSIYEGTLPGCNSAAPCQYSITYGDGSSTAGYFVKDNVRLNGVTGNFQTTEINGSVTFGCGAKQSGNLGTSTETVDGILGFGQQKSSMLSQLAASGKVKKSFAHCLDGGNGGGIFAIGDVVQPNVDTTPLVPNQMHYNVVLKAIEVGKSVLDLPTNTFDSDGERGAVIDSGTTLAYLPEIAYKAIMEKIMAPVSNLKIENVDGFTCFQYSENVDDHFPIVTFHFEKSVSLKVYPHDYLFRLHSGKCCVGWQKGGVKSKDGRQTTLLGDMVLANKVVVYDLENGGVGWTEYNCSSSIKVKDGSGNVYQVGAHNISFASNLEADKCLTLALMILIVLLCNFAF